MIALNIEQLKLLSVQAQLQQLCTTVLENKNMLDHWQDYIDEYRSLQMDDMIIDDDDDDMNQSIDIIEEHIDHTRIIIYDIMDRINAFHTRIESMWCH